MANLLDLELAVDFFRRFFRFGGTMYKLRKALGDDELMKRWIEALTKLLEPELVHDQFTPLADKLDQVKSWPGINPEDVDAAFALAMENGTIAGYESEVGENPHLDIVVTVYRATVWQTFLYARERMREVWGHRYSEWWGVDYTEEIGNKYITAIADAKVFVPNRIVIEVVDFGAHWEPKGGFVPDNVHKECPGELADFAVYYNASQSPNWVRRMDGKKAPYAVVGALLITMPDVRSGPYSPTVKFRRSCMQCGEGKAELSGSQAVNTFSEHTMPVLRKYPKP